MVGDCSKKIQSEKVSLHELFLLASARKTKFCPSNEALSFLRIRNLRQEQTRFLRSRNVDWTKLFWTAIVPTGRQLLRFATARKIRYNQPNVRLV
jgi:hypothetical protein